MNNLGPQRANPAGRRRTLSPARREVLDLLVDANGGMTVAEVAKATGAHPNTAREHLDALVQSGDLARAQLPAVGRGRPPMIYRALPNAREVGPEYRVLAEALVRHLAEVLPTRDEQRTTGLEAGASMATTWATEQRPRLLCAALFDAEVVPGTAPTLDGDSEAEPALTVRLRRCPVLDVARAFPEIVCSAHLGLIRGWVDEPGVAEQIQLQPFGDVGACLLRVPVALADALPDIVETLLTCQNGASAGDEVASDVNESGDVALAGDGVLGVPGVLGTDPLVASGR